MQFSINKAKLQASYDIASVYQSLVTGNQQSYMRESGGMSGNFSSQDKQIIDNFVSEADMTGLIIAKKVTMREDRGFRTYVLAYYPIGENNIIKIAKAQEERSTNEKTDAEKEHESLMRRVENHKKMLKPVNETKPALSQKKGLTLNTDNETKSLTRLSGTEEAEVF